MLSVFLHLLITSEHPTYRHSTEEGDKFSENIFTVLYFIGNKIGAGDKIIKQSRKEFFVKRILWKFAGKLTAKHIGAVLFKPTESGRVEGLNEIFSFV